jgi:hypothetical protein
MVTLFRNGGFVMYFILLFGLLALIPAVASVFRSDTKNHGYVKWMLIALLGSIVSGTCADVGATLRFVVDAKNKNDPTWSTSLLEGLQESLSPSLLGMSFITLTALALAVAKRREVGRIGA